MTEREDEDFYDTSSLLENKDIDNVAIDVASVSTADPKMEPEDVLIVDGLQLGGSDFKSSSTSLLKTILGAGLLAMPAAMASVGWVFGSLFIFASAGLALFGLVLLTKCAERLGRSSSIAAIAKETYPRSAKWIDAALALKCFGVAVSYLVVIGDMMPSIAIAYTVTSDFLRSRNFWVLGSIVLVGPLAFLRNLDSLKYTSLAGLGAVAYMVIIAIMNWYKQVDIELPPGMEPVPFAGLSMAALQNFPIFIFAFTAHQNICTIQNEAVQPTSRFMRRVIDWSVGLSAAAYFLFSIFCYATYGASTASNVFLNFPGFRPEMIFGRVLYTLLSAFSYPLLTHPCRASILNLLPISDETKLRHFDRIHQGVTSAIVVGTVGLALVVRNLGIVSALIGTFIGIPVCYIVPGLFYARMFSVRHRNRTMAYAMVIFGVIAMITSIVALIVS